MQTAIEFIIVAGVIALLIIYYKNMKDKRKWGESK
jgi:large-conductance mechanosensitive channel